jgi:hypothetical protein
VHQDHGAAAYTHRPRFAGEPRCGCHRRPADSRGRAARGVGGG